jgi:hypothetical protein
MVLQRQEQLEWGRAAAVNSPEVVLFDRQYCVTFDGGSYWLAVQLELKAQVAQTPRSTSPVSCDQAGFEILNPIECGRVEELELGE